MIKSSTIREHVTRHPQARKGLETWPAAVEGAAWDSLDDVRNAFPHADQVVVASGRPVVVFNIAGNKFRLVVGMHFNTKLAHVLRFMTHAEYDKDQWKYQL